MKLIAFEIKGIMDKTLRDLRSLEIRYSEQKRTLNDVITGLEKLCPHSEGWSKHPEELLEACNLCGMVI